MAFESSKAAQRRRRRPLHAARWPALLVAGSLSVACGVSARHVSLASGGEGGLAGSNAHGGDGNAATSGTTENGGSAERGGNAGNASGGAAAESGAAPEGGEAGEAGAGGGTSVEPGCANGSPPSCADNFTPARCVDGAWVKQTVCGGSKPVCSNGVCANATVFGGIVTVVPAATASGIQLVDQGFEFAQPVAPSTSCGQVHQGLTVCVTGGLTAHGVAPTWLPEAVVHEKVDSVVGRGADLGGGLGRQFLQRQGAGWRHSPGHAALNYAGTLLDANGAPLTGSHNIGMSLWDAATLGTKLCELSSAPVPLDAAGRFSVTLPGGCMPQAISAKPVTYIEVSVDGASLGRSRLGAVPYAVEANHAVSADSAAASGQLSTDIAALTALTHAPSAFHAAATSAASIPTTVVTKVLFDSVDFDLAGEYSATTGTFTAKQPGIYALECRIEFVGSPPINESAVIVKNGTSLASSDLLVNTSGGGLAAVHITTKLVSGDALTCNAYQATGATQQLYAPAGAHGYNTFGATRLY